ncbi:MAG: hypothetical protein ACK5Y6_05250, partial [Pseudomonadota bacterium]
MPPTNLTKELQAGILARTQRDNKVTLCHFVDMNNHSHQLCIPKEPHLFSKFYMEYQKKVADTVRKLLRRTRLNLWEGRPSVTLIAGLEDAIDRLVYFYMNPTRAGLVRSIDEYPGLNTWEAFKTCEPDIDATVKIKAYWMPASALEPLPDSNRLSPAADRIVVTNIHQSDRALEYELEIKPMKWLEVFGISKPEDIERIRQTVIRRVREQEAEVEKERIETSRPFMGAERLKQQEYFRPHTPKKHGHRISLICRDNERRPTLLKQFSSIRQRCRECYLALKEGIPHEWPPGTFIPWIPPSVCHA